MSWSQNSFCHMSCQELDREQYANMDYGSNQARQLQNDLNELLKMEEQMWAQRSRACWLRHDDKYVAFP